MSIQFTELKPNLSTISQYLKVFKSKNKGNKDLPNIGIKTKIINIQKYKALPFMNICGFDESRETVPSTYLHILAFPYEFNLLTHESFPHKLIGSVHLSNTIKQYEPVSFGDTLDLEVHFLESTSHEKGIIINVVKKIYKSVKLVWEEVSSFLVFQKQKSKPAAKKERKVREIITENTELFTLPSNIGRKYGLISGDINPIHLYPLTAKFLGFKKNIAHGFLSLSKSLSVLEKQIDFDKFELTVAFKTPIYLPNKVNFNYVNKGTTQLDFEVMDKDNVMPHLEGSLTKISDS